MSVDKLKQSLENLNNALQRLHEALQRDSSDSIIIDGTIQCYEFGLEILWKALKRYLAYTGVEVKTPRETISKAFEVGLINDESVWLNTLEDRNKTSHVYDKEVAAEIYNRIKDYYPKMKNLCDELVSRTGPDR